MKNVVSMSYLKREFVQFTDNQENIRYMIYTDEGSIITKDIETIKMIIREECNLLLVNRKAA